eukprot:Skav203330  [mRNA]  locus=scaffold284:348555:350454:- [translate_table: standard]
MTLVLSVASGRPEDLSTNVAEPGPPARDLRKDELEPLSHEELSQTYGLGFTLLQRMGYGTGALKPGALLAPLAQRANQGRKGLQEERQPGASWVQRMGEGR